MGDGWLVLGVAEPPPMAKTLFIFFLWPTGVVRPPPKLALATPTILFLFKKKKKPYFFLKKICGSHVSADVATYVASSDICHNFNCVTCWWRRNLLVLDGDTIFIFSNNTCTICDKIKIKNKNKKWNYMGCNLFNPTKKKGKLCFLCYNFCFLCRNSCITSLVC